MILTGPEIRRIVEYSARSRADGYEPPMPRISIAPFDPRPTTEGGMVGPNSIDLHLGDRLLVYDDGTLRDEPYSELGAFPEVCGYNSAAGPDDSPAYCLDPTANAWRRVLDMRADNPTRELVIPPAGLVLVPGRLYLGTTVEFTSCEGVAPYIDGRSSVGRLGIHTHVTAGAGDDGFGAGAAAGCRWTLEIHVVQPVRVYAGVRICQIRFETLLGNRQPYRGRYRVQDAPTPSRFWQDADHQREDG